MTNPRLSMKLLWKLYANWEPSDDFKDGVPQFLGFVESELKKNPLTINK